MAANPSRNRLCQRAWQAERLWLEDLDIFGATTLHGPVSVDFSMPTAVTLGAASASPVAGAALFLPLAVAAGLRRRYV